MFRQGAIAVTFILLSACRVQVIAPEGAAVITLDGSFTCLAGNTCEIPVDTFDIDLKLYAFSQPGYEFSHWSDGEGYICAQSEALACAINTTALDPENVLLQEMLLSDSAVYLKPVLRHTQEYGDPIWIHEQWPAQDSADQGF